MRDIPNEMAARIESGAATLCHVWRLERADGVVMGFAVAQWGDGFGWGPEAEVEAEIRRV